MLIYINIYISLIDCNYYIMGKSSSKTRFFKKDNLHIKEKSNILDIKNHLGNDIKYEYISKILLKNGYPFNEIITINDSSEFYSLHQKFKSNIKLLKKDWRNGSENLEISRDNLLNDSFLILEKYDISKEWKISFKGEVNYDAGGIIREWVFLICKEISNKDSSK